MYLILTVLHQDYLEGEAMRISCIYLLIILFFRLWTLHNSKIIALATIYAMPAYICE